MEVLFSPETTKTFSTFRDETSGNGRDFCEEFQYQKMILIGNNIHICNCKTYKILQSQPMLMEMLLKIILVELTKIEKELPLYSVKNS